MERRNISKQGVPFIEDVIREYNKLYNSSSEVDSEFLENYTSFLQELNKNQKNSKLIFENYTKITPNTMQQRAIENLDRLRNHGENKALVIAATGTGKTYMSAFDVKEYNPERLLFLVHRGCYQLWNN
ncbi:MAG: DEAD/DEAH box helicase family protein [Peptostreptococcaceae bacterium]